MRPRLFRIGGCPAGTLSIMARPRGGEWLADEIACLRREGVGTIVSLLAQSEVDECGVVDEAGLAIEAGLRFWSYPIPDRGVPADRDSTRALATDLAEELRDSRHVVIHCRAGIGRSALVAACVLRVLGIGGQDAWRMIERARGVGVPDTDEQRQWADAFLSLDPD